MNAGGCDICDGADVLHAADRAAATLWRLAPELDRDDADLSGLCAPLLDAGLTRAVLPESEGGSGLAVDPEHAVTLAGVLRRIGGASLAAGRLYEGHVNAAKLVFTYGGPRQQAAFASDVRAGAMSGVWNAETGAGATFTPDADGGGRLDGEKVYCSGAGRLRRPLVIGTAGALPVMCILDGEQVPADLSAWTPSGMRATATGRVRLDAARVAPERVIGAPGDYYRSPHFKGGAWRFCAVQLGAAERLLALLIEHLRSRGRTGDPHQRARVGRAAIAVESARLWVVGAATLAEACSAAPEDVDAYVGLARTAVERAALDLLELVDRSVGLEAKLRPGPIERVARDLSTYLRQPVADAVLDAAAARLLDRDERPIHLDGLADVA